MLPENVFANKPNINNTPPIPNAQPIPQKKIQDVKYL